MENSYKRTIAGSVGAGMASVFNASGRQYYVLEHKTESLYHRIGESQKIIVDQIELGRDASCQVRFDENLDSVSRHHAAIVKEKDGWKIINLSKTNATLLNGQPVQESILSSGDEIRLSSNGPVMGFIVPQGKQSMVSSIGLTERMNLFRQQALRPYKTAIVIMGIVLVLAVSGLVTWNILSSKAHEKQLNEYQEQLTNVEDEIQQKNEDINKLNEQIEHMDKENVSVYNSLVKQIEKARNDRKELEKRSQSLQHEFTKFKQEVKNKELEEEMAREAEEQERLQEQQREEEEAEKQESQPKSVEDIIKGMTPNEPEISSSRSVEEIINSMK